MKNNQRELLKAVSETMTQTGNVHFQDIHSTAETKLRSKQLQQHNNPENNHSHLSEGPKYISFDITKNELK